QPALAAGRGADRRLRARPPRAWAEEDRRRARPPALGRTRRLAQRSLALPPSARTLDPPATALARGRLPSALPAATQACAGAPRRGEAAGGVGRRRLLLRRSPARDEGDRLAADRDRRRLLVCLGRARRLRER